MKKTNKKLGFTLIELLIVITIIGILTIIGVSSFVTSQQRSRDAARKGDLKSLSDALNMYYADKGLFPETAVMQGLINNGSEFSDNSNPNNKIIYMKKVPSEEKMKQIFYETSSNKKSFRLYTNLENDEDKDCLTQDQCSNFVFTKGCCYVVTSSNASLDSLP
jgi:type II secretion system protein G